MIIESMVDEIIHKLDLYGNKEVIVAVYNVINDYYNKYGVFFDVLNDFYEEYQLAVKKHPEWPTDIIHSVSIMNEEAGESIRAALNYVYEFGEIEDLEKEIIQTAAMCIRNLINFKKHENNTIKILE